MSKESNRSPQPYSEPCGANLGANLVPNLVATQIGNDVGIECEFPTLRGHHIPGGRPTPSPSQEGLGVGFFQADIDLKKR